MSFKVKVWPSIAKRGACVLEVPRHYDVVLANKSERQAVIRALQDFDRKKPQKTAALSEEKK